MAVSKQTVYKFTEHSNQKKEINKPVNILSRWKATTEKANPNEKIENNIKKNLWKITKLKIKNRIS